MFYTFMPKCIPWKSFVGQSRACAQFPAVFSGIS